MRFRVEHVPNVTHEDVGTLWTRDDGSIWRIIEYGDRPSVTWERIDGIPQPRLPARDQIGGAVGSPITAGFVRLVREDGK